MFDEAAIHDPKDVDSFTFVRLTRSASVPSEPRDHAVAPSHDILDGDLQTRRRRASGCDNLPEPGRADSLGSAEALVIDVIHIDERFDV